MKKESFGTCLLIAVLFLFAIQAAAEGPLRKHPTNPRYFADATGKVVYLTGLHTWGNLQEYWPQDPPPAFDYTAFLNRLQSLNHNFFRLWSWESPYASASSGGVDGYYADPMPYLRTGPGVDNQGKPKYDTSRFDQAYFDRLRTRVIAARDRGMYAAVMLFNGWAVEAKINGREVWRYHPYQKDNNINGVDGDPNSNGQGEEVHRLQVAAVTALQEAYVRKVIDTVNDLDNVLYEVSNESNGSSEMWQYHIINLVKSYEAGKSQRHPVGMTVEWPSGSNADLFASSADWISPNGDLSNPLIGDGRKVVVNDTDHICGLCGDRVWVWKSFCRGLNVLFMDPYNFTAQERSAYEPLRKSLGYARDYAERMNLATALPHGELSSTGYCLADPSTAGEYLVYKPAGVSSFTVNLTATPGALTVEWLNVDSGEKSAGANVTGGTTTSFTAPSTSEAVLYLKSAVRDTIAPAAPQNLRRQ